MNDIVPLWVHAQRVVVLILVGCVAVVGLDVALGLYDVATDPTTKVGGLVDEPRPLQSGATRFVWSESLPVVGISFGVAMTRITEKQLEALRRGTTGSLHIGQRTSQGELTTCWEYPFALTVLSSSRSSSVEQLVDRSGTEAMALGVRYDATCAIEPIRDARASAMALQSAEIAAGDRYEVTILLDGDIPASTSLLMSYARRPRSLLRGTLLGRVSGWLAPR